MVFPPHFYPIEALAVTLCSCRCSRRLLVTLVQSWAGTSVALAQSRDNLSGSGCSRCHLRFQPRTWPVLLVLYCSCSVCFSLLAPFLLAGQHYRGKRSAHSIMFPDPFGSLGPINGGWTQGKAQAPCRPAKVTSGACHASCILRPWQKRM